MSAEQPVPARRDDVGEHDDDLVTEEVVEFDDGVEYVPPPAPPGEREPGPRWVTPLPTGVRATSNFGPRGGILHAGDDYAPPKPAQQGIPVFAIADGVVVAAKVKALKGHSGNGVLIDHGGKVRSYYGHLASFKVGATQRVRAGQQVGVMGHTGNVKPSGAAGTHLHLGILVGGAFTDPSVFLTARGVRIGSSATHGTGPITPKTQGQPRPKGHDPAVEKIMRNALIPLGYYRGRPDGVAGDLYRAAVSAYQRAQRWPKGGLPAQGSWDARTQTHFGWTRTLQASLNEWAGTDIAVDGDYLARTATRVLEVMTRNHGGAYPATARVDGEPGPVFCRMLGIGAHP
ncbi:peptidoglycan DD-metalloendopeptidase family protein [Occultella aeris]|uniref:Murein DD-endopeptidase MepM n=1 Tax=Occultella aeris TaxID=2761496 RepID=A0A7M4DJR3_9MICO|nr:peptidoglycan DD-metalloendopeptidase family protein [Occultella aeris]VZO37284.1 Murein DD-endopeptidase MepM [Occultella aeris]